MKRIAVIGAGHWGPNLVRNFHNHIRSEVSWVVDKAPTRLELVQQNYPTIRVSDDATQAFEDPDTDAVVIATPTVTHFELAEAALMANKHVLVEKPIAKTAEQVTALMELAKERERILMVGHVFLYNRGIQRVKEYLQQGDLGKVHYVSSIRTNLGPIRRDVNAAWDLAAHDLSIANYWLDSEPEGVSARGGAWINPGFEDAIFATLRYPQGVLFNLHVSWLNPRKVRQITVVCEKKMLTFDDMDLSEPLRLYDKTVTQDVSYPSFVDSFAAFRTSIREGDVVIPRIGRSEPLRDECDEFVACVLEGRQPLSDGQSGLGVVRTLQAIDRSMQNGGAEEKP